MAHIINDKLNQLEGRKKHICDNTCEYFCFPHLETACVLSGVFSVPKGRGCYEYKLKGCEADGM